MKRPLIFTGFAFMIFMPFISNGTGFYCHVNINVAIRPAAVPDTVLSKEVMRVLNIAVKASATFDIEAVANLYTPNAVVSDEEPPFSWNGPTAGIQWVNAVEKTCKDGKVSKLKAVMHTVQVFQQTDESVYVVVPVDYRGIIDGNRDFEEKGAFTFVLRMVGNKWLIKSQSWMPRKGL